MGRVKDIELTVMKILATDEETRADDHLLFYKVYQNFETPYSDFVTCFLNAKLFGLPPFESISRCRRKIQAEYPDLRPKEKVIEARVEKEKEFRAYAREKVSKRKEIC